MDYETNEGVATSFAAQAFGELRAEISLLRRAVERLTDERTATPDYTPTLENLSKRLTNIGIWTKRISETPALTQTPESLAKDISAAATDSRAHDRQLLNSAINSMSEGVSRIDAMIARNRTVIEQEKELNYNRLAFAVAGMVFFAIVPGAIARSLPVSWAVPERIAARMLGLTMWEAGEDMMGKDDPASWHAIAKREQEYAALQSKHAAKETQ
ncbi:hypothetical protein D3Y57_11965 [Sphingomonas paeninsulae]|uniref:Uncharacterized protein n=1 Tax=Sphingomonas paeninsulae TaxID=2319844 RepID=A0A494TN73_SPHPE|nr:DUF6118 family protein [Sphingomonas paeninsulae]AYJ86555.1 hypothetical protein D3Y57_11965 [Sphingomonas paeninsulae]